MTAKHRRFPGVAFAVIVLVIGLKPSGLFSRHDVKKV